MRINVNLVEENVIHINGGITINVDVSVKNVMLVKNIIFAILLHVGITCDEIKEPYDKKTKKYFGKF